MSQPADIKSHLMQARQALDWGIRTNVSDVAKAINHLIDAVDALDDRSSK